MELWHVFVCLSDICTCVLMCLFVCLFVYSDGDGDEGVWWMDRVDFVCPPDGAGPDGAGPDGDRSGSLNGEGEEEEEEEEASSDAASGVGSLEDVLMEKRTVQFTEYSMTSSVLPRSEGVCVCVYVCVRANCVYSFLGKLTISPGINN